MKDKLRDDLKIIRYVTSTERYKAIFFITLIAILYGTLALGIYTENFFESILMPFKFYLFNIIMFTLIFLNNLNLCSIFQKDFSFYIIRLKDKKAYIKTLVRLSVLNYLIYFLTVILLMMTILLLTSFNNISIYNYENYSISNAFYCIFYMFRYIIYGLLITISFTLININTNDRILIFIQLVFLAMFFNGNIMNMVEKREISLYIWTYLSTTTFITFGLEVVGSILILLILEVIFLLMYYISCKNKRMEIS